MVQDSNRIHKSSDMFDSLDNSDHLVLSVKFPVNEFNRACLFRQPQSSAQHFKL